MESSNKPPNSSDKLSTNLAWALKFVWESGPGLTCANVAVTLVQSILPLLGLYLTKLLFDAVAAGITATDKNAIFKHVAFLILLLVGVASMERALTLISELVRSAHSYIATDRIYEVLHAKSTEVDLEYYENPDYYDALHRAQADAPYRPTQILSGLFTFAQSGVSVIAVGALLLTFHWSVPAFLILAAVPDLLIRFSFAKQLYIRSRRQTPSERQALYFDWLLTGDSHAKEIRLFDLANVFVDRFGRLRQEMRKERLDLLKKRSVANLLAQVGAIIPGFALYGFLAYRALQGRMTVGDLVMFYQAVQRGQGYISQLLGSIALLYENNLFLTNIHEFLAFQPKVTDPQRPKSLTGAVREGIAFHDVKFRYPKSERSVLDGISLRIRPGEHIALVGENGCGKTTLVKLLLRLYDPTDGAITLDGIDFRELSVRSLRRRISVVFQDHAIYHVSAKENIWFGDVEVPPEEQRIIGAAQRAGAHKTIAGLPAGYDTMLGKSFADGEELSIGEWQKLALARAFWRQAEIIVLDEPSSALDAKAEYEFFNKFHQLSAGRTAILISHCLSTVRMADHIYFLENGIILESGSHGELIGRGGKYAYMFERQAQHYR